MISVLFPKNSKSLYPKSFDSPFFVNIIISIAKSKLDYAVREIIYHLIGAEAGGTKNSQDIR